VTQQVHVEGRLKGHPGDAPATQPKATGWHLTDWACELGGTAFQLFLGRLPSPARSRG
jgi:hypothetical protein